MIFMTKTTVIYIFNDIYYVIDLKPALHILTLNIDLSYLSSLSQEAFY